MFRLYAMRLYELSENIVYRYAKCRVMFTLNFMKNSAYTRDIFKGYLITSCR